MIDRVSCRCVTCDCVVSCCCKYFLLSRALNQIVPWCVQARRLEMTCGEQFVPNPEAAAKSTNVMDNWIQATLQGLVQVREKRGIECLRSNAFGWVLEVRI